jgi:hypothetical protein
VARAELHHRGLVVAALFAATVLTLGGCDGGSGPSGPPPPPKPQCEQVLDEGWGKRLLKEGAEGAKVVAVAVQEDCPGAKDQYNQ